MEDEQEEEEDTDADPFTCQQCIIIDTYVHSIQPEQQQQQQSPQSLITSERIQEQIDILNDGFQETPFYFQLREITITHNSTWASWNHTQQRLHRRVISEALRRGGPDTLNVFLTEALCSGLLGYSSLPDIRGRLLYPVGEFTSDDRIFLCPWALPRGGMPPFHLGKTLIHEAGHWLGLLHPFDGHSCHESNHNDLVDDTPQQSSSSMGLHCPIDQRDSCPDRPGKDLVQNYMEFSDDHCLQSFTDGQIERMLAQFDLYKRRISKATCGITMTTAGYTTTDTNNDTDQEDDRNATTLEATSSQLRLNVLFDDYADETNFHLTEWRNKTLHQKDDTDNSLNPLFFSYSSSQQQPYQPPIYHNYGVIKTTAVLKQDTEHDYRHKFAIWESCQRSQTLHQIEIIHSLLRQQQLQSYQIQWNGRTISQGSNSQSDNDNHNNNTANSDNNKHSLFMLGDSYPCPLSRPYRLLLDLVMSERPQDFQWSLKQKIVVQEEQEQQQHQETDNTANFVVILESSQLAWPHEDDNDSQNNHILANQPLFVDHCISDGEYILSLFHNQGGVDDDVFHYQLQLDGNRATNASTTNSNTIILRELTAVVQSDTVEFIVNGEQQQPEELVGISMTTEGGIINTTNSGVEEEESSSAPQEQQMNPTVSSPLPPPLGEITATPVEDRKRGMSHQSLGMQRQRLLLQSKQRQHYGSTNNNDDSHYKAKDDESFNKNPRFRGGQNHHQQQQHHYDYQRRRRQLMIF